MFNFKPISRDSIPQALAKAERYRLLNEPTEAESICLDVLAIDAQNQQALVMLLLSLTDQFRAGSADRVATAREVLPRLTGEYERLYYSGIICERDGHARALRGLPGSGAMAYERVRQAMQNYEQAEALRPPGNDDAILRWNTCVRICQRYHLGPATPEGHDPPVVGDD